MWSLRNGVVPEMRSIENSTSLVGGSPGNSLGKVSGNFETTCIEDKSLSSNSSSTRLVTNARHP